MLPCIICGTTLEPAFPEPTHVDDTDNQPYRGTIFVSYGNYGSTVFDPISDLVFLQINICDGCLIERKDRVLHVTKIPATTYRTVSWNPISPT